MAELNEELIKEKANNIKAIDFSELEARMICELIRVAGPHLKTNHENVNDLLGYGYKYISDKLMAEFNLS